MSQESLLRSPGLVRLNRVHDTCDANGLLSTCLLLRAFGRSVQTFLGGRWASTTKGDSYEHDESVHFSPPATQPLGLPTVGSRSAVRGRPQYSILTVRSLARLVSFQTG